MTYALYAPSHMRRSKSRFAEYLENQNARHEQLRLDAMKEPALATYLDGVLSMEKWEAN